ncbi:M15 family metallopeptidase [Legionella bononiensis]|uniref:D-alanyl-D-alanine dipeptidase n=1 Tax=Legionella bononiensis TaxID=2793102 RepID=A0ABS1WA23_9GAMM|nr:M15 family metallopeptidase [Legionella bononiensis]MBL7480562.1 M15 family metallopeptidase [Legionella bononiensis]MBL7526199.1 M15 family metallopeptidase [Legionella bononiensis]MBL7563306.1 M15 family metallopeptidase [Legionella bononiensis]
MKKIASLLIMLASSSLYALPKGFVYLHEVAPDILQDMRYATSNNFIGNPIPGYLRGVCIVTRQTAEQLKKVEQAVKTKGYTLKVYDCYRPQQAVNYFYKWSQNSKDERQKPEYYPREIKKDLFKRDYIALTSGHTRGSTVDLTLVQLDTANRTIPTHPITRCYDKSPDYLNDNSIDMGTRFDCLDVTANSNYTNLSKSQKANRSLLKQLMISNGFKPYYSEWWHYTLRNEPFPHKYFNFPVQ